MLLWHVLDGADGQLARLTGTASEWGKVMDGLCDHGTFVALYTALAWSLLPDMGGSAFLLAAGAGLSHFVQATAYERQRQLYEYIVLGKPTLIAAPERVSSGLLQRLYRLYLSVQQAFSGERQLVRVLATAEPEIAAAGREQYRRLFRPVVHGWSLLSSNYRTVALFVACSAGAPVAFLWWELVGLNVAMVLLRGWTYRRHQRWLALMQDQATLERH
jgi:phosphatidylglycerophosphate synthase